MGSTICTAGFPSAAIASSCFTARCDSIWYGFFIATLLFSAKENSLSAYQGWERGVATFYDLTDIPGKIIDVNLFLLELLGCTHAELLGKELWQLGLFSDIDKSQKAFQELQE